MSVFFKLFERLFFMKELLNISTNILFSIKINVVSVGIIQHVWILPVYAFEANEFAIWVFIDLSKAFDTIINHDILLPKPGLLN